MFRDWIAVCSLMVLVACGEVAPDKVECEAGQFLVDDVCMACEAGTYSAGGMALECVACEAGTFDDDASAATVCIACAACADTEFTLGQCAALADTECGSCREPGPGEFVSGVCTQGGQGEMGRDTIMGTCSEPGPGEFVSSACVAGNASTVGADTEVGSCRVPQEGEYVSLICVPGDHQTTGKDSAVSTCSEPGPGEFVTEICMVGNTGLVGSDTVSATCSEPIVGTYVTAICIAGSSSSVGSDTARVLCSLANAGQYVAMGCVLGSSSSTGSDTVVAPCTGIDNCATGLACTTASNSVCEVCEPGFNLSMDSTTCRAGIPTIGPISWGTDAEFQNVFVYAVDKGSDVTGTMAAYSTFCGTRGKSIPNEQYPHNGCGGGAIFNSDGTSCPMYMTAHDYFYNQVLPVFTEATYDNILIMQSNAEYCFAHNAEEGSMHAFGGPAGDGYSFCRDGDSAQKRFHIYVCK